MTTLTGWAYPDTVEEAIALLQQSEPHWEPIAGGTSWAFRRRSTEVGMMDVTRLPLHFIERLGDELELGALVTFEQLRRSPLVAEHCQLLQDMAESLRPQQLRNAVTLGGNAVQVFAWSDLPVALLALGATLHVATPPLGDRQAVTADSFFLNHPRRRLEGQLLTSITVAADRPGRGGAYQKLARSRVDLALVSAAAQLEVQDGTILSAHVAVGCLRGLPERLAAVEHALVGSAVDDPAMIGRIVELTRSSVAPSADHRVSREYRTHVSGVLVGRVVSRALARALEG